MPKNGSSADGNDGNITIETLFVRIRVRCLIRIVYDRQTEKNDIALGFYVASKFYDMNDQL